MAETWDESKPAGSRSPTLGDDDIREFKRSMRERLAEDHDFEATESPVFGAGGGYTIGKHKFVTLVQRNTSKVTASDEVAFVCKSVSGNPEVLLTPPSAGTDRQITKNSGANLNLNSGDFASGIIPSGSFAAGAVNSSDIADDAVVAAKIAASQVNSSHIVASQVNSSHIGANQVNSSHIATGGITPDWVSHGFVPVMFLPSSVKEFTSTNDSFPGSEMCSIAAKLPSGATALWASFRIKNSDPAKNANAIVYYGAQYSGVAIRNAGTYAWTEVASACDVSGLTPGTVYSVSVRLWTQSDGDTAYLDGLSIWWE